MTNRKHLIHDIKGSHFDIVVLKDDIRLAVIMIITWIHVFYISLLCRSDCEYLTGVVSHHRMLLTFVLQDINGCVKNQQSSSPLYSYTNQLVCFRKHLLHCLLVNNPISERQTWERSISPSHRYCGAISVHDLEIISSDTVLFIEVITGHFVHHEILEFNFKTSRYTLCRQHGLLVLYEGYTSDMYCGRRVPWTIIIPSDSSYLRLITKSYMPYELSIFYNSFQNNLLKDLISVEMLPLLVNGITLNGESRTPMKYYVFASHLQQVHLNVLSSGPVHGGIIVKDGPGRLSNTIVELKNTNSSSNIQATTSAFWAFIDIFVSYTSGTVIEIRLNIVSSAGKVESCNSHDNTYLVETSPYHRNVICSNFIRTNSFQKFIGLTVKSFSFQGSNTLTDKSSSRCQYGGVTFKFYSSDKGIQICEDARDYDIFSKYDLIQMTLVWFYGYSRGHFVARKTSSQCQTVYLELSPPHQVYRNDIVAIFDPRPYCYYVVCPPVHMQAQRSCTIRLGPPSLTATTLEIKTRNTLEACNANLKQNYLNEFISYKLSTMSTVNWPFGLINGTTTSHEQYNISQKHTYDFLHFAKIKLRLLCDQDDSFKQMAVLIRTSACGKTWYHKFESFVVNNIPTVSDSCPRMTYMFTAVKTQIKKNNTHNNYHDFIYAPNGHTRGHVVDLTYKSCPATCRNFNYSVFVRGTDNTDIIEYTTSVGYGIFTGYYHRGFRVKIIIPETDCVNVCLMALSIQDPDYPINTKDYDLGSFLFYSDR